MRRLENPVVQGGGFPKEPEGTLAKLQTTLQLPAHPLYLPPLNDSISQS